MLWFSTVREAPLPIDRGCKANASVDDPKLAREELVMPQKVLRLSAVKTMTGLSRSSVYQKISVGDFPRSIALGPRAVGWLESDVELWIESKIAASRTSGQKPRT